ncbi:MAG: mechanosensitive ion channel family protein [Salinarchaeum sp.]
MTLLPLAADPVSEGFQLFGIPPEIADPVAAALVFVVVFGLFWVVGRSVVVRVLERLLGQRDIDVHARRPILKVGRYAVLFAAVTVAFGAAGYGNFLTSLATIAAAATLAIGFAMQDVIKNFVAGVFVFIEEPFRIGDWIEWDDHAGTVEDISLRVTRVRTFDNELLTVPNAQLTDGVIKNPVAKDQLRVKITFGIGYDDDIDEATDIILEEAQAHEGILADPKPSVRVTELGDSAVGLQSRIWIDDPSRSDVVGIRSAYVQAVKERFDEADIDMPYPHRQLVGGIDVTEHPLTA